MNIISTDIRSRRVFLELLTGLITSLILMGCLAEAKNKQPEIIEVTTLEMEELWRVNTNPVLDEVIIDYEGFRVSFNPTFHMPNWVAWTLSKEHLDNSFVTRKTNFRPDETIAGNASLTDYRYSGFDRAHMAPAGDMKWSEKAMSDAAFLTNICPQVHSLNNGAWKRLEEKCRSNVMDDSLMVIIAGPVLTGDFIATIGETPLQVPGYYFKVIYTPSHRGYHQAIGFLMRNGKVEGGMQGAACSVDEIERVTGHDFFTALPDSLEMLLESQCNFPFFSDPRYKIKD